MIDLKACAEIQQRCEKATAGPWENRMGFVRSRAHGNEMIGPGFTVSTQCLWVAECRDGEAFYNPDGNADFIAAARQDIPYLLSAITALTERNAELEGENKRLVAFHEAWVNAEVSHATGNPDLVKKLRAELIAAHKVVYRKLQTPGGG